MSKRIGRQTIALPSAPAILSWAAVVGKKEGEGPLGAGFDYVSEDSYFGQESWEKAESQMLRQCFAHRNRRHSPSESKAPMWRLIRPHLASLSAAS